MEERILAQFEVINKHFVILGTYEIEEDVDFDDEHYKYPAFKELIAKELVNGNLIDYKPTGQSWAGHNYDVADMINGFLANEIQNGTVYKAEYIDAGLQAIIDEFRKNVAITVDGLDIPIIIMDNRLYNSYKLMMVTNDFIYYGHYDEFLMLSVKDHSVVSDNYFAEVGYSESCENIASGKETLLWGTPEQE